MADQQRLMAEHEEQQQQQQTSVMSVSTNTSSHSPRLAVVIAGCDTAAGEMQQQQQQTGIQSPSVVATRDHEQQTRKKTSFQITSVTVGSRASNDGGEDSADDLDESHTDDPSSELLDVSKNTDEVCDVDQSPITQPEVTAAAPSTVCVASTVAGGGGGGGLGGGHTNVSVTVVEAHNVPMAVAQHPDIQWQNRFKVVKIETGEPFRRGRWLCMNFHDPPASQGEVAEKDGTTGSGSGNSSTASSSHHGELASGCESTQITGGFGVISAAAAGPGGMLSGSESGFYSGEAPIYPVSIILQTQQQGGNLDFTNTVVHMQGKTPDYMGATTGQQLPLDYLHHHHHHQQQQQQTLGHHVIPPHTVINPASDFLQHQQGASVSLGSNVDYAFPQAPPDPSSPPPPLPHPQTLATTGSIAPAVNCQPDYSTATTSTQPPSAAPLTTHMNVNPPPSQNEYSQVTSGAGTGAVSGPSITMPNTSAAAAPPPVSVPVPVPAAASGGQPVCAAAAPGQPPATVVPVPQAQLAQQQQPIDGGGSMATVVRPANIALTVSAMTAESLVEASVGVLMSPQPIKEQTGEGEDSESASGASTVAIDNKIEQAMDLVKSHLMFAVREEVDVLKEKITELMERISQLEMENTLLRASASPETLAKLSSPALPQASTTAKTQQPQQQPPTATS